jgi:hypothetical protein
MHANPLFGCASEDVFVSYIYKSQKGLGENIINRSRKFQSRGQFPMVEEVPLPINVPLISFKDNILNNSQKNMDAE